MPLRQPLTHQWAANCWEPYKQRHLAGVRWTANELTDMVYPACAAGYADFVVTERHMAAFINQSNQRLGRPSNVYRRLRELVGPVAACIEDRPAADSPRTTSGRIAPDLG